MRVHAVASTRIKNQMRSNEIKAEASSLRGDIIYDILSMLPAKSLLRFKSVCKTWRALISDHLFTQVHLNQSKILGQCKVFSHCATVRSYAVVNFLEDHKTLVEKLDFPVDSCFCPEVLCSCDGLVLFKGWFFRNRIYVLWNTSARMYTKFICPYQICPFKSVHGISFDTSTNDYKVVVIFDKCCVVYSLKNNSWSGRMGFSYSGISQQPGVNISGALYWVVIQNQMHSLTPKPVGNYLLCGQFYNLFQRPSSFLNTSFFEYDNCYSHEILCFDPNNENFRKLRAPNPIGHTDVFYVTDLGGCLGLYRYSIDRKMMEIWSWIGHDSDSNSWVKFKNIENMPTSHVFRPLCLMREDEIMFMMASKEFVVYNCKKKEFHLIPCFPEPKSLQVVVFQDSLVLPSLGNDKRRRWRSSEKPKKGNQDGAGTGANETGKRGRTES